MSLGRGLAVAKLPLDRIFPERKTGKTFAYSPGVTHTVFRVRELFQKVQHCEQLRTQTLSKGLGFSLRAPVLTQ